MALPADVGYCTITGRYTSAAADGVDGDSDPDGVPLVGLNVTFAPSLTPPIIKNVSATPPVSIKVDWVEATTDATGALVAKDGVSPVKLLASDYPDSENPWVWHVSVSGPTYPQQRFTFIAPTGATVDLTTVLEAPGGSGYDVSAWSALVARAEATVAAAVDAVPAEVDAVLADPTSAASIRQIATIATTVDAAVDPFARRDFVTSIANEAMLASETYLDLRGATPAYRRQGARCFTSSVISALDAAVSQAHALSIAPAYTNLVPANSGGAVGVVGSGGSLPFGWQNVTAGVSKTVVSVDSKSIVIQYGTAPNRFFGGVNVPAGVISEDMILTLDATLDDGSDYLPLSVGWWDGTTLSNETRMLYSGSGRAHYVVKLPNPGGSRFLQFRATGLTDAQVAGHTPKLTLENLNLHKASETGSRVLAQPTYEVGTIVKRDATICAADGDYAVIAETVAGRLVYGTVTATGGSFSLLTALGGGCEPIQRLYVVAPSKLTVGLLDTDAPIDWVQGNLPVNPVGPIYQRMPVALGTGVPVTASTPFAQCVQNVYGIKVASNRARRARFEVRPGDVFAGDSASQERSEFNWGERQPFSQDLWLTDDCCVLAQPYVDADQFMLLHQLHYVADAGTPAWGPEYSLTSYPNPDGTMTWKILVRGGAGVTQATPWQKDDVRLGEWHRFVVKLREERTGNGAITLWVDGEQVYTNPAIPLGYNVANGPEWKIGFYGHADETVRISEHANAGTSLASLASVVANPLPI